MRHLSTWALTSNHRMTFELMSQPQQYSHLGDLVLTQGLLVQLIAICIALLVSFLCLCDISIFFFFFNFAQAPSCVPSLWGKELDSVWYVINYSFFKYHMARSIL